MKTRIIGEKARNMIEKHKNIYVDREDTVLRYIPPLTGFMCMMKFP